MAANEETRAEIQRLYCETKEPIAAFSKRLGVTQRAIYLRAKAEGWPPRRPLARRRARANPADVTRAMRDDLIRRLYAALTTKLTQLERRMAESPPLTQEESERQTREVGSMIQGLDKVTEIAADVAKSDASARPALATAADIERLRRDLAERLHRIWGIKKPRGL